METMCQLPSPLPATAQCSISSHRLNADPLLTRFPHSMLAIFGAAAQLEASSDRLCLLDDCPPVACMRRPKRRPTAIEDAMTPWQGFNKGKWWLWAGGGKIGAVHALTLHPVPKQMACMAPAALTRCRFANVSEDRRPHRIRVRLYTKVAR